MRRSVQARRRVRSRIPATPSVHPCVLMNCQDKPRDARTLAHELGHGVHQVLAAGNGALKALMLAETASVSDEIG